MGLTMPAVGGISLFGRWYEGEPMPTARAGLAVVALRGRIYAIGGFDGVNWLGTVEAYDPAADTWETRSPMPTPRDAMAAVAFGGHIHVLGGNTPNGPTAAHEIYDPAADAWTTGPALPAPARFYARAAATLGRIWVVGGYSGTAALAEMWSWYTGASTWRREAALPAQRYLHGLAALGHRLFAVGGATPPSRQVYAFDPVRGLWQAERDLPEAAQDVTATPLAARLHVLGGSGYATRHYSYDPEKLRWEKHAELPLGRDQFGAAALGERLHVIGGYRDGLYLSRHDIFVPFGE